MTTRRIGRASDLLSWLILLVVVLALILSGFLVSTMQLESRKELEESVVRITERLSTLLEAEIESSVHLARDVVALVEIDPAFVEENYERIARGLLQSNPSVVNIALAPNLVVNRVYPMHRNAKVLGLDLKDHPVHGAIIDMAITQGAPMVEGPVATLQGGHALITRVPVYRQTEGERRLWGVVSVVIDFSSVLENAGLSEPQDGLNIGLKVSGSNSGMVLGAEKLFDERAIKTKISVPGQTWVLFIQPTPEREAAVAFDEWLFLLSFLATLGLALTLVVISLIERSQTKKVQKIVADSLDVLDDGFVIYDEKDRFVLCNDAYRQLYNKSLHLLEPGTPFEEIIRDGVKQGQYAIAPGREEEFIQDRLDLHRQATSEAIQKHADGRWLKIAERRTSAGYTVGSRVDITELEEARESAEEAYQVKSEFISVLSHELRTPLTIILGYAKVISNVKLLPAIRRLSQFASAQEEVEEEFHIALEELTTQISKHGRKMESSGNHLLVLINDLLDYSKIESGHFELQPENFSIKSVISSVIEDMSDSATCKGLTIEDRSNDIEINADKIRIKQTLINLIGNAIKFTEHGSIEIGTRFKPGQIEIDVRDTGCGISMESQKDIFEAFRQAEGSDRRSAGGTGLGLAISRRIVEMHGGELSVMSEVDIGTTFTVRLPLQADLTAAIRNKKLSRPMLAA